MFDARVDVGQFIMQMNPNHRKFKKTPKNPTIWIMLGEKDSQNLNYDCCVSLVWIISFPFFRLFKMWLFKKSLIKCILSLICISSSCWCLIGGAAGMALLRLHSFPDPINPMNFYPSIGGLCPGLHTGNNNSYGYSRHPPPPHHHHHHHLLLHPARST